MKLPRGTCPVCGQDRALSAYGRMRQHLGEVWIVGVRLVCAGTGLLPETTDREGGTE